MRFSHLNTLDHHYAYRVNKSLRFVIALSSLLKKSSWGPFTEVSETTKFDHSVTISWSQGGEDIALLHAVSGQHNGTYIDVGAHHPSRFSVTRHLYQMGWSGVNVDANQDLIINFNNVRPRDINLCFAVGMESKYIFTVFEEPAISTLDTQWREKFISEKNKIDKVVEVNGRTLRLILDDFKPTERVDLLSIDAEGSDLQVLKSLEFQTLEKTRFPRWLLLEASPPISNALDTPSVKLAMKWGYEPYMVLAMSTLLKFTG
jgi:FkbM family methyltransferase